MNKLDMSKEREAFDEWNSRFDHDSNEWQDMGLDEVFIAGMQAARAQINSGEWVSVEEFEKRPQRCWCWIFYKGRVTAAYYQGLFYFNNTASDCFMTECVDAVMPWEKPQPPEKQ